MRKNKGLYLLIAFISIILIFFFALFFAHERKLENGILFKVSFEYDNAKEIIYNFYNQNGKIGKVENWENYETSYLLDKTEYNSVKLLRKILKGRKEQKEPSKEEGITIYNGQNKKYYFLPFDSESAEELAKLIIDGYIHSEIKRVANKTISNEIYLYETTEGLNWTKDGSQSRIIHTYQCEKEDCKYLYVGEENETLLYDKENYIYNYVTKNKELINTTEIISNAKYVKWEGQIIGINLQNDKKEITYYDLTQKECLTPFTIQKIKAINNDLLMTQKENQSTYELQVWNRWNKENLLKVEKIDNTNIEFEMEKIEEFLILKRIENKLTTYQLWNEKGKEILPKYVQEIEIDDEKNIITKVEEENQIKYEKYTKDGTFLKSSSSKEEL